MKLYHQVVKSLGQTCQIRLSLALCLVGRVVSLEVCLDNLALLENQGSENPQVPR